MADPLTELPSGFVLDKPAIAALPPGFILDVPEQIAAPATETDEERPGFVDRISADFEERGAMLREIKRATEADEQTLPEGILQTAGKVVAGSVLDVIGEGLVSGVNLLSDITPDEIEDPVVNAVVDAGTAFLETDLGKAGVEAAQSGLKAWNEFTSENPRAARNIEAVVDLGLLLAPVKAKPKIKARPTFAGKLATKLDEAATVQSARQRASFVDDLIRPKKTKVVREAEIGRTAEGGVFRSRKVDLSPAEKAIADDVSKIPGVSSKNTQLTNLQEIRKANRAEADNLVAALQKNDIAIPRNDVSAALSGARAQLAENPLIVGDAARTADKIITKAESLVASNPATATGLLKSRRQLDQWIQTQKPKVFDTASDNALTSSVREVRTSINNLIDARATNVAVKDSLKTQSNLFRAIDNIGPKAADEGKNAVIRLLQRVGQAGGVTATASQQLNRGLGILAGSSALGGVAAGIAPFLIPAAGLAGIGFAGGKFIGSPAAKKALSSLLRMSDKAIRTTKDQALLARLRADRGAVMEIMKQFETIEEPG